MNNLFVSSLYLLASLTPSLSLDFFNKIMKTTVTTPITTALDIEVDGPSACAIYNDDAYITNLVGASITKVNTLNDSFVKSYKHPALRSPYNISFSGKYAYIANYQDPMVIFDADAETFYKTNFYGKRLAADPNANKVYLVDVDYNLKILDTSNPTDPTLIKTVFFTNFYPQSVTYDDNNIYLGGQPEAGGIPTQTVGLSVYNKLNGSIVYIDTLISTFNYNVTVFNSPIYVYLLSGADIICFKKSDLTFEILSSQYPVNAAAYDGNGYLYITQIGDFFSYDGDIKCANGSSPKYVGPEKYQTLGAKNGLSILKLDTSTNQLVDPPIDGFNCPQALAVLPDGNLYVLDGSAPRLACSIRAKGYASKISLPFRRSKGAFSLTRPLGN